MIEISRPVDPEFTPAQVVLKEICEDILALKRPGVRLTFHTVDVNANPEEIQQRLRDSSLSDLMLEDGASLSAEWSERRGDLGLIVGKAALTAVQLRGWGWEYKKYRVDPNGPDTIPYDIIEYPGEKDWQHQLDIALKYENGKEYAYQKITGQTSSMKAGNEPEMSRDIWAAAYAEQGYEGHNQLWREAKSQEEVIGFIALARELFEARAQ